MMVAYRPHQHKRAALLRLLHEQHLLVRSLGLIGAREPWLMESATGEIVYVVSFDDPRQIEACWENEAFQDFSSQLSEVAEQVPLRNLQEASGPYIDMEELQTGSVASDDAITGPLPPKPSLL